MIAAEFFRSQHVEHRTSLHPRLVDMWWNRAGESGYPDHTSSMDSKSVVILTNVDDPREVLQYSRDPEFRKGTILCC